MASAHRVVYPEIVRRAIKSCLQHANDKGRGTEAMSALKEIDRQLRQDPLAFGDPWYSLTQMKLQVMSRIFPPWCVVYGLHREKPVVFVGSISLYPESEFDAGS